MSQQRLLSNVSQEWRPSILTYGRSGQGGTPTNKQARLGWSVPMDNSGSTSQPLPPYYILVSHSSVNNAAPGAQSSNFSHPIIQYQYQDDSALPLLPQHPDEHVLILDYEPLAQKPSVVKSISPDLVVTGLKVDDAPGAAAADEKNAHMFVIETTSDDQCVATINFHPPSSHPDFISRAQSSSVTEKLPHATLAQFKQRYIHHYSVHLD